MYRCVVCGEILKSSRPEILIDHLRRKHPFVNLGRHHQRPHSVPRPGTFAYTAKNCPPPCPLPRVPPCPPSAPLPAPCPPQFPSCPPRFNGCVPQQQQYTTSRRTPRGTYDPFGPCGPCPPQPCPPAAPRVPSPCPVPCAVNCPAPTRDEFCRAMAQQKRKEMRTKYKCTVESWKPGLNKVVCPCCGCESQPIIRRQQNQLANNSLSACLMLWCWPLSCLPFILCESSVVNLYCATCNNFLGAYNRKLGCVVDVEAQMCNPGIAPNFPMVPH